MTFDNQELAEFIRQQVTGVAFPILAEGYTKLVDTLRSNPSLARLAKEKGIDDVLASNAKELAELKKGNKELVTTAEKIAEKSMADAVREKYGFATVGEEHGYQPGSQMRCVFDPVDGTSAMIRMAMHEAFGIPIPTPAPTFGISVGVVDGDEAILGVIAELKPDNKQLSLANIWIGGKGIPATQNGVQITLSPAPSDLTEATLSCTVPKVMFKTRESWSGYQALDEAVNVSIPDQNCIGFMRLLNGGVDVAYESDLAYHDVAALVPILESTGIKATDHKGNALRFPEEAIEQEFSIFAAQQPLYEQARAVVERGVPDERNAFNRIDGPVHGYATKFSGAPSQTSGRLYA